MNQECCTGPPGRGALYLCLSHKARVQNESMTAAELRAARFDLLISADDAIPGCGAGSGVAIAAARPSRQLSWCPAALHRTRSRLCANAVLVPGLCVGSAALVHACHAGHIGHVVCTCRARLCGTSAHQRHGLTDDGDGLHTSQRGNWDGHDVFHPTRS